MLERTMELHGVGLVAQVEPPSSSASKRCRHEVTGDATPAVGGQNTDERQMRLGHSVAREMDEADDRATAPAR